MALTLNTNMASLYGQMYLGNSQSNLTSTMQQLSSGLRINSASDDPAGYAITTSMTSQINGMNQATINANNAISFSQVAQGGLSQVTSVLQQMRNLAVQSANDTNSSSDRSNLDAEYQQLAAEVTRLGTATTFNGTAVFGSASHTFQVGANATDTISISSVAAVSISGDVSSQSSASNAITAIDAALGTANTAAATLGSYQNRFQAVVNNLNTAITNTSSARSQIQDTNFAAATANLSKQQILQQAGTAMLAQANKLPQSILSLLQ